jgi:integrase
VGPAWLFTSRWLPSIPVLARWDTESRPPELCTAMQAHKSPQVVRAYYLLRYTGQRRIDVARMKASQFDGTAVELFQVKTGAYVWVPAHKKLREHLWMRATSAVSAGELSVFGPSDIDDKAPDRQGTDDEKTDNPRSVAFSPVTRQFYPPSSRRS